MSKLLKWLAITLAILAVFLLGLIVFLHFYLSSEVIIAWIKPPLERYLQREVSLDNARVGLRGFSLEGLEIRQKGSDAPLLKGEKLELRWKLQSLLQGNIEIDTLALTRPEISLVRLQDGSLNISDFLLHKNSSESDGSTEEKDRIGPADLSLIVSLLAIQDGRLTLVDRSTHPETTLHLVNLESRISSLSTTAAIPFRLEGQIGDKARGSFGIEGTLDLGGKTLQAELKLREINLPNLMPFITKNRVSPLEKGSLFLAASISTKGPDNIKGQGTLQVVDLQIKTDKGPSQSMRFDADFQVRAMPVQKKVLIESLDLLLNGQKATLEGLLSDWHKRPRFDFTLTSPQIRLDELLALMATSPPASGSSQIIPKQPRMQEPAPATLPPSTKNSSPSTASGSDQPAAAGKKPVAAALVPSEVIIALVANKSTESTQRVSKSRHQSFPLDAQGAIHVDWFFYDNLIASNVDCVLTLQKGALQAKPLIASLYDGKLEADVTTDLDLPGPPFQVSIVTNNVLLDEFVAAFSPKKPFRLIGNFSLQSQARGIGDDLRTLQSQTDLRVDEAEFSEHPLLQQLASFFQAEDLQRLPFDRITAEIHTDRGIATVKDLSMIGPIARVRGGGTIGLLDRKLDLSLLLQLRAQYAGKIAALREILPNIADKEGFVRVPLGVSGTVDQPQFLLDKSWMQEKIEQTVNESLKELEPNTLPVETLTEENKKVLQESLQQLLQ